MAGKYTEFDDAMFSALDMARGLDRIGIVGYGVAHLMDGDGNTKQLVPFSNLITTFGDEYYAKKGIHLVQPGNLSYTTVVNGMKLGTSTTAAAKSGANSFIVTYITGSNNAFDATYPQAAAVGGDGGWNAIYKTTWPAGDATSATINEVAVVTDQASDTQGAAASTISRAIIATVNKQAADSLAVTWNHKFLGA